MLHFRPGDKMMAEVTSIRMPPKHIREKHETGDIRILTVGVELPHSKLPHFTQISWSPRKIGKPVPELGGVIEITFSEPYWPFERNKMGRGALTRGRWFVEKAPAYMRAEVLDECHYEKESDIKMSKDRVKFWITWHTWGSMDSGTRVKKMFRVLEKAFGVDACEWSRKRKMYADGCYIICRPSQFARFLIYRNEAGLQNQFKELRPELYTPVSPVAGIYEQVAEETGTDETSVRTLTNFLGISRSDLVKKFSTRGCELEVDVSKNPRVEDCC